MLEQTVSLAQQSNLAPVDLYCAPDTSHTFFAYLANQYHVVLKTQKGSNLGKRMENALSGALKTSKYVVLIGTDCPQLNVDYLQQAFEKLTTAKNDIVIGPAEDGGYVLIGASRVTSQLFDNIEWSTKEVYSQTIEKINQLGWKYHHLDMMWDLDTEADFHRLPENYLR